MTARPGSFLGATGAARFVVTDRDGVRRSPSRPSRLEPDPWAIGFSVAPFAHLDLATHVGDDVAVVEANRRAVLAEIGVADLAIMNQIHGATVATIDPPKLRFSTATPVASGDRNPGVAPIADGLVTTIPGLALTVLVADCVPVVLADEAAGVVAVAHAGRRGVQVDVVGATIEAMVASGADPERVTAVIGPAVCPGCYEVPAAMQDEVALVVPEARATSYVGTPALHLRRAVATQLQRAGVGSIDAVGGCTVEDRSLYSYRRDGHTGRFAMLAWLRGGDT